MSSSFLSIESEIFEPTTERDYFDTIAHTLRILFRISGILIVQISELTFFFAQLSIRLPYYFAIALVKWLWSIDYFEQGAKALELLGEISGDLPNWLYKRFFDTLLPAIKTPQTLILCIICSFISYREGQVFSGFKRPLWFIRWHPIWSAICVAIGYQTPVQDFIDDQSFFFRTNKWYAAFAFLLGFKFLRTFVHFFSFQFIKPKPPPVEIATVTPNDVTVVMRMIPPRLEVSFYELVRSFLDNGVRKVIVVTVGLAEQNTTAGIIDDWIVAGAVTRGTVEVTGSRNPSKRVQFVNGVLLAETNFVALSTEYSKWPLTYLANVLPEFEDNRVGIVGTCKTVERRMGASFSTSVVNYLATMYLLRHNYEFTSTYNIDGGVYVISNRTAVMRTDIVQSLDFRTAYMSESCDDGILGMDVDDDNFVTRYMVKKGWKTVFVNKNVARTAIRLGEDGWARLLTQLVGFARTQWRSNWKVLFVDGQCWIKYPWTTYASFLYSLINISIVYDPMLFWTLHQSGLGTKPRYWALVFGLIFSKLIKGREFWTERIFLENWFLIPVHLLFGYFHSILRLYALVTVRDVGDIRATTLGFVPLAQLRQRLPRAAPP